VRDLTQELERVTLLLQRVGGIDLADDRERLRHDLPFLALALRRHQFAADLDRGAGLRSADVGGVVRQAGVGDDLDALQAGAVVQLDEGERFRIASRAHPTLQQDGVGRRGGVEGVFDESSGEGHRRRFPWNEASPSRAGKRGFRFGAARAKRTGAEWNRKRRVNAKSARGVAIQPG